MMRLTQWLLSWQREHKCTEGGAIAVLMTGEVEMGQVNVSPDVPHVARRWIKMMDRKGKCDGGVEEAQLQSAFPGSGLS